MKYKNVPKILAEEAWRMITDDCKQQMISLKETYIKSLTEDINHYLITVQDEFTIDFAKWLIKEKTEELMFDRMQNDLKNTYENMLEIFKKEKGL